MGKRTMILFVLMVSFAVGGVGQSAKPSTAKIKQELMQMERDWSAACLRHDKSVVERLLADDYIGTDGRGLMTTKADEIREADLPDPKAPPPPFTVVDETVTDLTVRVYKDTAVINGRTIQKIKTGDQQREIQYRRTTVWVKRQGRWQCISFHGSRIMTPPSRAEGPTQQQGVTMAASTEVVTAAVKGNIDQLKALIEGEPSLMKARDEKGRSAILLAIFAGKPQTAKLLAARDDLDIFEAAALGRATRVQQLLRVQPSLAKEYGADGFTALHYASHLGFREIAEKLLASGADVSAVSKNGLLVMPLQSAVAGASLEIAKLLLAKGAPINARQEQGTTVLHVAAVDGNLSMVKLLIEKGADVKAKQETDGKTPLALALEKGHSEVAAYLRQHGAR